MRRDLPSGTVTFLFTDIEGSTRLLDELGESRYAEALAEHRSKLREAFTRQGGVEVDTQGDAFFVAFPTAPGALAAASDATDALAATPIRVRIGIHTGTPHLAEEGYVGVDVHLAARIAASGHGGQVLVSAATAALVGTDSLRDLGAHRLKDLSAPERIYQLGSRDFPPLKTLHQTNLPIPATPFLGREHELAQVQELLFKEDVRMLTLVGPGGTGKTRLALQAAAEASDRYRDGVFWVPLAPLREAELVVETAAQALGAKDGLAEHIGDKRLLFLFDNFEQVVDAAPALSELLTSCPNLHLLVTSRELLRVPGEQAYPVPPLEPPDGTELFLARARAVAPDFEADEAVPELCARLEQLPLALELAAARIRMLSAKQLLDRLSGRLDLLKAGRGVDPRQQTLRATIEWSYDLLDDEERRLFARLAVFRGGCTLESAEQICDADLDVLQSLVDKSLVRVRDGERFWMLETIREYALEWFLASDDADALRRRHAERFLALAEEAEPNASASRSPAEWLDRLEREHDNLRAALDFLEASGETQLSTRLAAGLSDFWYLRGHVVEGSRRLEDVLAADDRPTPARAKALTASSNMAITSGNPTAGRARAEEALSLYRALGDQGGIANAAWAVGYAVTEEGDPAGARPFLEESVRLFREVGDEDAAVGASRTLAFSYHELGELERAAELHEQNLGWAREIGNKQMEARSLGSLAVVLAAQGRFEAAAPLLTGAYRIDRELGARLEIAQDVGRFAEVLAAAGQAETAVSLVSCSEALCEELGAAVPWVARMYERTLARVRDQLDEEAFSEAWERGRKLTAEEAVAIAVDALGQAP